MIWVRIILIDKPCLVSNLLVFLMVNIIVLGYNANKLWSIFLLGGIAPFALRELYARKQLKIKLNIDKYLIMGLVSFGTCIIIAGLVNGDLVSLKRIIHDIRFAVPFLLGAFLLQNYKCQSGMYWGIFTSTLVLCIFGVLRWDDSPNPMMLSIYPQHNSFGMVLELLIPFLISFAFIQKSKIGKLFTFMMVAFAVCCLYFSGSRGSIIGLGGGIFITVMLYLLFAPGKIFFKTRVVIALFCLLVMMVSIFAIDNVTSYRQNAGGGERLMMIEASYDMWKDHKLAGVGAANWAKNYYGQYRLEGQREKGLNMPHNMPAYYLSTTGIIGFMGYCAYIIFTGFGLIKIMRKQEGINFGLMAVLVMFWAFFIHGMVDGTLITGRAAKVYFLLFSLALIEGDKAIESICKKMAEL